MARTPSTRTLQRWLATGRPRRIEQMLDSDPSVVARLEAMTALDGEHVDGLHALVDPPQDFGPRVTSGLRQRWESYDAAVALADLLGLGLQFGRVMFDEAPDGEDGN